VVNVSVKTRQNDPSKKRILDEATRTRRIQRQLEKLEKDNFHDDPHAAWQHLANKTKLPTFSDGSESKRRILDGFMLLTIFI